MKTSIIVPVWNHLYDLTKPWVEKMLDTRGDWELIIVDNGSEDGTKEYLKTIKDKRVKKVYLKKNTGFSGGNNAGYARASGELICFISNDVIPQKDDWLEKFVDFQKENEAALIGPQYVDYNSLTTFDFVPTPYMCGWCVFGSRALFEEIKEGNQVWCEDFGEAYFEDVWMSVQAQDKGYELLEFNPGLTHIGSQSSDQINIPARAAESQQIFRNKMMEKKLRDEGMKRVVFFAPGVPYPFIDGDYEGKGVGGAESALILLARQLAKMNYRVEIYNKTDVVGKFNDVYYYSVSEFQPSQYCDFFVLFRAWHPVVEIVNADTRVFWSCDQYTDQEGLWDMKVFPYIDVTVAISPYHLDFLKENYKIGKATYIDLGVNLEDYQQEVEKIPGKAIFCSVPIRGLDVLAECVPKIKEKVPEFNLTITSDFRLWGSPQANNYQYKGMFHRLPYVNFVGKVSRQELVQHQLEAEVMTYPCTYEECFCISALECLASGAVPITNDIGAMKTTVGDGGVLSNGLTIDGYVDLVVKAFADRGKLSKLREKGKQKAEKHDWKLIAKQWDELFTKELHMPKSSKKSTKKKATAPVVKMPSTAVLTFNQFVEVGINGQRFATDPVQEKGGVVHQMEVPYDKVAGIMAIINEAYGPAVIES